jgi:hypothetical protein
MTIAWSGVKKFAGALRSAQRLMGLYPLWRRSCGDVFCEPAKSSAVALEHQGAGKRTMMPAPPRKLKSNPKEGGSVNLSHTLRAGEVLSELLRALFNYPFTQLLNFLSDTPDGQPGETGDNPIRPGLLSHTPAVPPRPLKATADDNGSGVIQAGKLQYHKSFSIIPHPGLAVAS